MTTAPGQSGQMVIAIACGHFRNKGLEHAVCRHTVSTHRIVFKRIFAVATIASVRTDLWHCKDRYDDKKPMTNGQLQEVLNLTKSKFSSTIVRSAVQCRLDLLVSDCTPIDTHLRCLQAVHEHLIGILQEPL